MDADKQISADQPPALARDELAVDLMERWRQLAIPCWRRVLAESLAGNDARRADYARWMLRVVLADPEHPEPGKGH
jgi:hypothetical protein